jgi:UDP-N-acetylmuramoylalanine-D-glutamate ligase
MTDPRPKLSWSDLAGARVGVWGLRAEGHASVRKLHSLGAEPVLVDDHPDSPDVLATGEGGLAALESCDAVVKTPGVSRYRPEVGRLSGRGIPVVGGLGLWLAEADLRRVLCVTGTKGKSTTTFLTGHLLTGLGYQCLVGGNIGVVPYDPAEPADLDYWVIEVSSYQATDLPCTPPVTAVTALHPDHLDWHGGVERYYRDKLSMCTQPGADLTVANGDSDLLRQHADLLGPRVEWVSQEDEPGADWMTPLGLLGRHNRRNALIARRCLAALGVPGGYD